MNPNDWYINEILRKAERERLESPRSMERWLLEWRMTAPPKRALAGWLGDRLVGVGERLRGWSAAEPGPMRRALQD